MGFQRGLLPSLRCSATVEIGAVLRTGSTCVRRGDSLTRFASGSRGVAGVDVGLVVEGFCSSRGSVWRICAVDTGGALVSGVFRGEWRGGFGGGRLAFFF